MAINLISAITGNLDIPGGSYAGAPFGPPLIKVNRISTLDERAPAGFVDKLVAAESPRWYQSAGMWDGGPTSAYCWACTFSLRSVSRLASIDYSSTARFRRTCG